MSSGTPRKFKLEPIETTSRSSRSFAYQPVDITSRSSRTPGLQSDPPPPRRKFAPQPVEVSHVSSKSKTNEDGEPQLKTKRRFAPQLIEESPSTSRTTVKSEASSKEVEEVSEDSESSTDTKPVRRKFAPELVETAQRTRKAGDNKPALLPSDKTDAGSPQNNIHRRHVHSPLIPTPPVNTPDSLSIESPTLSSIEARRLGIPLPKRTLSRESMRQHSFHIPGLDPIASSDSDKSDSESLSTSPPSSSDQSRNPTRRRESFDGSGYLLELAAKAAERQLREQALAAFPNDDRHIPVAHFIDRDEATASNSRMSTVFDRRDSGFTKTDVHYQEMRRHQEAWAHPVPQRGRGSGIFENDISKDLEMARIRARARPPMLGADIKFPRSESPEPARFDVTQGCWKDRNAMCYLTEQVNENSKPEGLWCPPETKDTSFSQWSKPNSRASSRGGLWGGFCTESGHLGVGPSGPTGLMTPRVEPEDFGSLEHASMGGSEPRQGLFTGGLPPSPPPSNSGMANLDEKLEQELQKEKSIDQEFGDAFVTQVYNYLSLGYPSLARRFDAELSKISGIAVAELRRDDHLPSAKGYIRFGDDEDEMHEGIREVDCWRWRALKLYIKEWARQQPFMVQKEDVMGGFGVVVRRGSWAW